MTESRGAMTAQQLRELITRHLTLNSFIDGDYLTGYLRFDDVLRELNALSAHNTAQLQKEVERTKGYDAVLAEVGKLQGIVEAGDAENVELQAALEAKEKELAHFQELQNVDPYQYAPSKCCGDAHMRLQFTLEAIKEIGFETETREEKNLTEVRWRNKRAETAEAELERLRSQGAGQWEAALRRYGHHDFSCTMRSSKKLCDCGLDTALAGLASPPEGKP